MTAGAKGGASADATATVKTADVTTYREGAGVDARGFPMLALSQRYEDAGHIGRGGMGHVRAIRDGVLGREVAAKMLDADGAAEPIVVQSFVEEAQITAQLDHPNIVPVYDHTSDLDGNIYFTMKRVQGQTLHTKLRDPALPPGSSDRLAVALDIFLKTCDAVAFAHRRGVLHRDIKPANIMVGAFGEVYLMDWGLAKVASPRPGFMAPEMVNAEFGRIDERLDIFGLGAVLYQMVTGSVPFEATTVEEVLAKNAVCDLVAPDAIEDVFVPKKLARVIEKAMAREPEDRYATVQELAGQVREFLHRGMHLPRQTFAAGQIIAREGEIGDRAFIVTRGRCARDVLEDSFSPDTWEGLLAKTLVERFRELDARVTTQGQHQGSGV